MTDITNRLRNLYINTGTNYVQEAADTIDTLRQRIKELEGYKDAWIETAKCRDTAERELAALKAKGEPVAWMHELPGRVDVIHATVKDVKEKAA